MYSKDTRRIVKTHIRSKERQTKNSFISTGLLSFAYIKCFAYISVLSWVMIS